MREETCPEGEEGRFLLVGTHGRGQSALMSDAIQQLVRQQLARAPEWIRRDLLSGDAPTRRRAEDALAAIIAAALMPAQTANR